MPSSTESESARHHIVVVNDFPVGQMTRASELAQTNLGSLLDDCDVFDLQTGPGLGGQHRIFDVVDIPHQTHFAHVDLLQSRFNEAAACIGVVV
jgi:hypothetical protein